MMPSYLLACECGKTHPVGTAQAGGQVVCSCGQKLDVPPLRTLRHLPAATKLDADAASPWNVRKGAIAICVIVAGLLTAIAVWNRMSEPTLPEYDPAAHSRQIDQGIDQLTPVQAWRLWIQEYRPLAERGLAVLESPHAPVIRSIIANHRFFQTVLLIAAGIFAVVAIVIALWPQATR